MAKAKRDSKGRFLPKGKARSAAKPRRKNPIDPYSAAAVLVNPSKWRKPSKPTGAVRKYNPPGLFSSVKKLIKPQIMMPIVIGGGIGVAMVTASNRYLTGRISNTVHAILDIAAGVLSMPLVKKLWKGAEPYAAGVMVGSGVAKLAAPAIAKLTGLDDDQIVDMGDTEFYGDYGDVDQADDGDDLEGFADDAEAVMVAPDGAQLVVDGYGYLPPHEIAPLGGNLPRLLASRGLAWLLRVRPPRVIVQILRAKPPIRAAMLAQARKEYEARRGPVVAQGPQYKTHRAVARHPMRRRRVIRTPVRFAMGRGRHAGQYQRGQQAHRQAPHRGRKLHGWEDDAVLESAMM